MAVEEVVHKQARPEEQWQSVGSSYFCSAAATTAVSAVNAAALVPVLLCLQAEDLVANNRGK